MNVLISLTGRRSWVELYPNCPSSSFTGVVKRAVLFSTLISTEVRPYMWSAAGGTVFLHPAELCHALVLLAEAQGFEPWNPCRLLVFKTSAIDHSAKLPKPYLQQISRLLV